MITLVIRIIHNLRKDSCSGEKNEIPRFLVPDSTLILSFTHEDNMIALFEGSPYQNVEKWQNYFH